MSVFDGFESYQYIFDHIKNHESIEIMYFTKKTRTDKFEKAWRFSIEKFNF